MFSVYVIFIFHQQPGSVNMKNILFTHSYFMRLDPKQWSLGLPYAPLGTLYAAATMREQGYSVSLFDSMFAHSPAEVISYLERDQPSFFVIYDDGFNYLTKMCLQNMREAAFSMISFAKERGCIVIISGSDSTDRFGMYLDKGADFIIMGEGEITLTELVNAVDRAETDFSNIDGLAFKQGDAPMKTKSRGVMKDLDSLPLPAWNIVDMYPYREMWMKSVGYFSMNMGTTRGCPFKCNWCAKPIYGNRYNSRSPQHVVDELKMLKNTFGFDHIWFCDDIFGLKPGWIKEFADIVEREKLSFRFKMQGRVDLLLQENNIMDLKRAGCENIWMGAESGSQRILDAMDKGTTVEQIYEATKLLKKCGIKPSLFIQFGYLTETAEDIAKTIAMINELLPYEIGISVSYPLPGTAFYEKVKAEMTIKTNWKDSDELALMFSNTYQPAFYRQLHRYVHRSYKKHIALENLRQIFSEPMKTNFVRLKKALSACYYLPSVFYHRQKLSLLQKPAHG